MPTKETRTDRIMIRFTYLVAGLTAILTALGFYQPLKDFGAQPLCALLMGFFLAILTVIGGYIIFKNKFPDL